MNERVEDKVTIDWNYRVNLQTKGRWNKNDSESWV